MNIIKFHKNVLTTRLADVDDIRKTHSLNNTTNNYKRLIKSDMIFRVAR
jgi:hypothetical protein